MSISGWIGVDLDQTLAEYSGDVSVIGEPIEPMCDRVRKWLKEGVDVRIVTARVSGLFMRPESVSPAYPESPVIVATSRFRPTWAQAYQFALDQERLIQAWCEHHLGKRLPVTALKDYAMIELWDDRAIAVESGTGRAVGFHAGRQVEK